MSSRIHLSRFKDSAAIQFMILDLLDNLLSFSEDPRRMGSYLAQQIRELVGARVVVLLQSPPEPAQGLHTLVAIEPERFAAWEHVPALESLARLAADLEQSVLWRGESAPLEAQAVLQRMGFDGVILSPLQVGPRRVGLLVALHLLDTQRNADTVRVLEILSPVAALVLRNALFMEGQEREIQARTRELQESERQFATLAEVAPVGIFRLDAEGRQRFVNRRWQAITGVERAEAPGELIHPEDRSRVLAQWESTLSHGHPFSAEFRIQRPDGTLAWVLGEVVADRNDAGDLQGFIGSLTDLSESKRSEAEREALEAQLVQAQKLESLGRLAGGVAHDINNTLTVILGNVEILRHRMSAGDPLLAQTLGIAQAVERSRGIIQQLLAFSRKQVIEPRVMDVNAHIRETQRTLAPLIGEDIHLQFLALEELWRVRFDPSQLDQILINLVVNARDAMPDGGRLVIGTENVHVDGSWMGKPIGSAPGPYIRLTVTDEGHGMNQTVQAHIFEPFFSTKESGKGTGLGLATVFGIVKQNGGFLDVYSEPGLGTTFRIYLPALPGAEVTVREPRSPAPAAGTGTILVVEDDGALRELIPTMIEQLGYRVVTASTPSEALKLCAQEDAGFDLLLTDVVMPGMSGRQLGDRVLELKPDLRVLFMSGYTSDMVTSRGVLEAGIHFIQKPFSMDELARKIQDVLDGP